jgi:CheY-like chemotaxis protein
MALIAIVDDSRLARTFNAAALKKLGHDLVQIDPTSMGEVLTVLREKKPDLLLMDYLMPNCPGPKLVRACHEDSALAGMKIVLLTAHHEDEVHEGLEKLGVQLVLHKPVDPKAIEEIVSRLLGA